MRTTALDAILTKRKISQSALARLIGRTPSFVCRLARGTETPSQDTIDAVLKALGISYEELFPRRKGRAA